MKYKVGNIVRIREDLEVGRIYGKHNFIEEMEKYKGKQAIIECIFKGTYDLSIDNGDYRWTEEMLEPSNEKGQNTEKSTVKSGQFTKKDLKFGDILTLRNGDVLIYTGIATMRNSEDMEFLIREYDDTNFESYYNEEWDIIKVQRYIHYSQYGDTIYTLTTLYERKEEILDEKEKEYLSKFVRPFRNKIRNISKMNYENEEWLNFILDRENGIENFSLPSFNKNKMYKGMETYKEYTLEELGL